MSISVSKQTFGDSVHQSTEAIIPVFVASIAVSKIKYTPIISDKYVLAKPIFSLLSPPSPAEVNSHPCYSAQKVSTLRTGALCDALKDARKIRTQKSNEILPFQIINTETKQSSMTSSDQHQIKHYQSLKIKDAKSTKPNKPVKPVKTLHHSISTKTKQEYIQSYEKGSEAIGKRSSFTKKKNDIALFFQNNKVSTKVTVTSQASQPNSIKKWNIPNELPAPIASSIIQTSVPFNDENYDDSAIRMKKVDHFLTAANDLKNNFRQNAVPNVTQPTPAKNWDNFNLSVREDESIAGELDFAAKRNMIGNLFATTTYNSTNASQKVSSKTSNSVNKFAYMSSNIPAVTQPVASKQSQTIAPKEAVFPNESTDDSFAEKRKLIANLFASASGNNTPRQDPLVMSHATNITTANTSVVSTMSTNTVKNPVKKWAIPSNSVSSAVSSLPHTHVIQNETSTQAQAVALNSADKQSITVYDEPFDDFMTRKKNIANMLSRITNTNSVNNTIKLNLQSSNKLNTASLSSSAELNNAKETLNKMLTTLQFPVQKSSSTVQLNLEIYSKMRKMGVPDVSIRQKMVADGASLKAIDSFFEIRKSIRQSSQTFNKITSVDSSPPSSSTTATISEPYTATTAPAKSIEIVDETGLFEKYIKMKKMNLPDGAIRQKMMTDQMKESDISLFFDSLARGNVISNSLTTAHTVANNSIKSKTNMSISISNPKNERVTSSSTDSPRLRQSLSKLFNRLSITQSNSNEFAINEVPVIPIENRSLESYSTMLKLGITHAEVRQKMLTEGVPAAVADWFLGKDSVVKKHNISNSSDELTNTPSSALPTTSYSALSKTSTKAIEIVDETGLFEKYIKMRKMNLPDGAIRQKMMTDQMKESNISLFFESLTRGNVIMNPLTQDEDKEARMAVFKMKTFEINKKPNQVQLFPKSYDSEPEPAPLTIAEQLRRRKDDFATISNAIHTIQTEESQETQSSDSRMIPIYPHQQKNKVDSIFPISSVASQFSLHPNKQNTVKSIPFSEINDTSKFSSAAVESSEIDQSGSFIKKKNDIAKFFSNHIPVAQVRPNKSTKPAGKRVSVYISNLVIYEEHPDDFSMDIRSINHNYDRNSKSSMNSISTKSTNESFNICTTSSYDIHHFPTNKQSHPCVKFDSLNDIQPVNSNLEIYSKMRKMGVPDVSIRQKMVADGASLKAIESFFEIRKSIRRSSQTLQPTVQHDEKLLKNPASTIRTTTPFSSPKSVASNLHEQATRSVPKSLEIVDESGLFEKYIKMRNMNLPEGAIRQKMMTDQMKESDISLFFDSLARGNVIKLPEKSQEEQDKEARMAVFKMKTFEIKAPEKVSLGITSSHCSERQFTLGEQLRHRKFISGGLL